MFKKILIANRGEIAVRIIGTARKMNIECVSIYAFADKEALHVQLADEAYALNSNELNKSYLDINKITSIAKQSNCDAIHHNVTQPSGMRSTTGLCSMISR